MNTVKTTKQGIDTLVELCPELSRATGPRYALFVTISPNPKTLHSVLRNGKTEKIVYGKMPQRLQYIYCMRIVNTHMSMLNHPKVVGCAELNKHGDLHIHYMVCDETLKNDVDLNIFRRDVSILPETVKNTVLKNGKMTRDYMHNIVKLFDVKETTKYLMKDNTAMVNRDFDNFYLFV